MLIESSRVRTFHSVNSEGLERSHTVLRDVVAARVVPKLALHAIVLVVHQSDVNDRLAEVVAVASAALIGLVLGNELVDDAESAAGPGELVVDSSAEHVDVPLAGSAPVGPVLELGGEVGVEGGLGGVDVQVEGQGGVGAQREGHGLEATSVQEEAGAEYEGLVSVVEGSFPAVADIAVGDSADRKEISDVNGRRDGLLNGVIVGVGGDGKGGGGEDSFHF